MSIESHKSGAAVQPRLTLGARVLLIPYAMTLGLIVWLPASEASKATGIVFLVASWVSELTGLDPATSSTLFEFLANIVLFVPLGLLVALDGRGRALGAWCCWASL